jgi:hypothetical protein
MDDSRDIAYAVFGFCFGIWGFFWGFKRLRRKRMIENIPTSTIRAMALGLVEVKGKAERISPLRSPLTNTECVLYKYLVEEYRQSGKSGRWVTIASGNSFNVAFWLDDTTAKVLVFPQGAELFLPMDYEFSTGMFKTLPPHLINFMERNAIAYKSWFGMRSLRFKEWIIMPGEDVYVLGSAKKTSGDDDEEYREKLMQRITALKNNPDKMKGVDLNKDGRVSIEEWDAAVAKIEQNLLEQELKNSCVDNPIDVIIGKGDTEKLFLISDQSEKELTKKLAWQSLLGIYGAAALSLATLAYILFRFGFLK